jgi:hypothetical protein
MQCMLCWLYLYDDRSGAHILYDIVPLTNGITWLCLHLLTLHQLPAAVPAARLSGH